MTGVDLILMTGRAVRGPPTAGMPTTQPHPSGAPSQLAMISETGHRSDLAAVRVAAMGPIGLTEGMSGAGKSHERRKDKGEFILNLQSQNKSVDFHKCILM